MTTLDLNDHVTAEPLPPGRDDGKPAPSPAFASPFAKHTHKSGHNSADYYGCLEDAERLLRYAAESGLTVDDATRSGILDAQVVDANKWDERIVGNLLNALAKLAAQVKPVTAESLRAFNTKPTVHRYWLVAIMLATFIVPYSLASFVFSSISQKIQSDITTANSLAVQLNSSLSAQGPTSPGTTSGVAGSNYSLSSGAATPDTLTALQTFASTTREIYRRAGQLNHFVLGSVDNPYAGKERTTYRDSFELTVPLTPEKIASEAVKQIEFYQDVRFFSQSVIDDVSVFYGAVATCILPVLYALLGTCAFLLRSFSQQMHSRTFVPSRSDSPRFLIAAIGGAVIGFFTRFTAGPDTSISPLAIAFLVGYAVDVFFSLLDGLVQNLAKKTGDAGQPNLA